MTNFPQVTLYTLGGGLVACEEVSPFLWIKLKKFKNISKKNPHEISFIPINTVKKLKYIDDLVCSELGTEFTVIYHPIDKTTYKILYGKSVCLNYEYYNYDPTIPETCECPHCSHWIDKIQSLENRDKRIKLYLAKQ